VRSVLNTFGFDEVFLANVPTASRIRLTECPFYCFYFIIAQLCLEYQVFGADGIDLTFDRRWLISLFECALFEQTIFPFQKIVIFNPSKKNLMILTMKSPSKPIIRIVDLLISRKMIGTQLHPQP